MGHGRSATFVATLLVARGLDQDASVAEDQIQSARPRAALNAAQRRALEASAETMRR